MGHKKMSRLVGDPRWQVEGLRKSKQSAKVKGGKT